MLYVTVVESTLGRNSEREDGRGGSGCIYVALLTGYLYQVSRVKGDVKTREGIYGMADMWSLHVRSICRRLGDI